jgi:hypothetical protein
VSFIKRAQDAAKTAAEQAQQAAGQAKVKAGEVAASATRQAQDPATQERIGKQAREAVGLARRGITTVVERIDPGTLAEMIVKATALQEKTNAALRAKGSPYRISEIAIEASIPPGVSFSIGRIDDPHDTMTGEAVSSEELVDEMAETGGAVIALDGTTLDEAGLNAARAALAADLPEVVEEAFTESLKDE